MRLSRSRQPNPLTPFPVKERGNRELFFNPSLEEGGIEEFNAVGGVEPFKGSTNFEFMLSRLGLSERENLRGGNLRGYVLVRYLSCLEARLEYEEMSALR
jgi:hypothetical protein